MSILQPTANLDVIVYLCAHEKQTTKAFAAPAGAVIRKQTLCTRCKARERYRAKRQRRDDAEREFQEKKRQGLV